VTITIQNRWVFPRWKEKLLLRTQRVTGKYHLHLIGGELSLLGQKLQPGDGIKLARINELEVKAEQGSVRALWFDLPG